GTERARQGGNGAERLRRRPETETEIVAGGDGQRVVGGGLESVDPDRSGAGETLRTACRRRAKDLAGGRDRGPAFVLDGDADLRRPVEHEPGRDGGIAHGEFGHAALESGSRAPRAGSRREGLVRHDRSVEGEGVFRAGGERT